MATLVPEYTNGRLRVRSITDATVAGWDLALDIEGSVIYMSFDEARTLVAAFVALIPNTSTPTTQPTEEVL
jgi:hypothetical protein